MTHVFTQDVPTHFSGRVSYPMPCQGLFRTGRAGLLGSDNVPGNEKKLKSPAPGESVPLYHPLLSQRLGPAMQSVRIQAVRVFIVAPQIVCWGLERLVQSAHPSLELLGSTPSITDPLPSREAGVVDVVVVDFDGEESLQSVVQLQQRTTAKIVVLTASRDVQLLDTAVRSGVRGVVRKSDPPAILLKAIEKVHEGELWVDRGAAGRLFLEMARQKAAQGDDPEKTKIATLTSRERQTIAAVASDAAAPAKVIAQRLCISEHTLRNHLTSIYSKLDVSSRLGLYAYATQHSLQGLNKGH